MPGSFAYGAQIVSLRLFLCLVLTFVITLNLPLSLFLYPNLSLRLLCASASLFSHLSPAGCLSPLAACGDTVHPAQARKRYAAWMSRIQFRYATWLKKTSHSTGHIHTKYGASCAKLFFQSISLCPVTNHFLLLPVALSFHPRIILALSFNLSAHAVCPWSTVCMLLHFFPLYHCESRPF